MTVLYFETLAGIALSLSILMAIAWVVQRRTSNSGRIDTIRGFSVGLVGAGSALWPMAGGAPDPRQWLVAALVANWQMLRSRGARYHDYQSRTSMFFPLPRQEGVVT
jgi:steroid 5-alpha reductase family enzyme